ncbi:Ig-like domain repeat protein [Cellulomonas composti]|uniref:beta-mannosidase n=1 Tax=Cellulomonas composti TaxID=266130 RepID=A0A511J9D8_9CELL|nr:Ig-like domain repeat protein [Cellulomonas composti]GEL94604.1 hypothetical protein CCO02nite_12620 [Cellulomonas composti]
MSAPAWSVSPHARRVAAGTATLALVVTGLTAATSAAAAAPEVRSPASPTGRTVEVVGTYGDWDLYVEGEPYVVQGLTWGPKTSGAGSISDAQLEAYLDDLDDLGVNTIRTWGTDAGSARLFDAAATHDIRVIAGFWIQPGGGPGSGGCPNFVSPGASDLTYLNAVRADVATYTTQYKDDPGVLMWDVGNESLLGLGNCYSDPTQLEAQRHAYAAFVDELAEDIHAIDPNHPVTSTDAWVGAWPYLKADAPSLDLYGINTYKSIDGVQAAWEAGGYTVPYVVTETGPSGEWEVPDDANGVPTEPSDIAKAQAYRDAWTSIRSNSGVALGATMFHFGTESDFGGVWLNLLTGGEKRLSYYAVAQAYGGAAASANSSPRITAMSVPTSVAAGSAFTVTAAATDPDGDPITYQVMRAGTYATGDNALVSASGVSSSTSLSVTAPTDLGVWKYYVLARDGHGNVGIETRSVKVVDTSAGVNVARGANATASSQQDADGPAKAVDGNTSTKWGSYLTPGTWAGQDAEWFQVDLGEAYLIDRVRIVWEAAYGKDYDVLVSSDGVSWSQVAAERGRSAGTHVIDIDEQPARYVKWSGVHRGTAYGYSFYEFQVYSATGLPYDPASATATVAAVWPAKVTVGSTTALPVTVTSSGSAAPTGTVRVLAAGVELGTATLAAGSGDGVATATLQVPGTLAVGTHGLVVRYDGDAHTLAAEQTVQARVRKAPATVLATVSTVRRGLGGRVKVKVTSTAGTPTGKVVLRGTGPSHIVRVATLVDGAATITLPRSLAAGTQRFRVVYSSDARTAGAKQDLQVLVRKALSTTTARLAATPISPAVSPSVTVVVRPKFGTPKGRVTVRLTAADGRTVVRGVDLVGDRVTLTLPRQPAGTYTVRATFTSSSPDIASSASSPLTLRVR